MSERAIDVYLNDHLAGSTIGADLADQLRQLHQSEPLGDVMTSVHAEIQRDRDTLSDLMERMDISPNPIKQAGAWVAEKVGSLKFSGATSGDPELGTFLALESLSLGIEGKSELWQALKQVQAGYEAMSSMDFDELIARAASQRATVDAERAAACERALKEHIAV